MQVKQAEFDIITKEQVAIELLKKYEPVDGYQFCMSFGKDSIVAYDLTKRSGVKNICVHNRTGIDPPELIRFGRENYPEAIISTPKYSIWTGVEKKGLPGRMSRWCCEVLKEYSGKDKTLITGIRAQESSNRKKREQVELNRCNGKNFVHVIFGWTEKDVWDYIHTNHLPYCELYDLPNWNRIGCIMCPMQSWQKTLRDYERYPQIGEAWFRAASRYHTRMWPIWLAKESTAIEQFPTASDLILWWLTRGQISIGELVDEMEHRGLRGPEEYLQEDKVWRS